MVLNDIPVVRMFCVNLCSVWHSLSAVKWLSPCFRSHQTVCNMITLVTWHRKFICGIWVHIQNGRVKFVYQVIWSLSRSCEQNTWNLVSSSHSDTHKVVLLQLQWWQVHFSHLQYDASQHGRAVVWARHPDAATCWHGMCGLSIAGGLPLIKETNFRIATKVKVKVNVNLYCASSWKHL